MSPTAPATPGQPRANVGGMLERRLEEHLFGACRRVGAQAFKLMPTVSGMPDRMLIFPGGTIYLIELKTEDGALTEIQKHRHSVMARLGVEVHVLYGRTQIDDWLRWAVDNAFEYGTVRKEIERKVLRRSKAEEQREERGKVPGV